jgi:hypothetical protein
MSTCPSCSEYMTVSSVDNQAGPEGQVNVCVTWHCSMCQKNTEETRILCYNCETSCVTSLLVGGVDDLSTIRTNATCPPLYSTDTAMWTKEGDPVQSVVGACLTAPECYSDVACSLVSNRPESPRSWAQVAAGAKA